MNSIKARHMMLVILLAAFAIAMIVIDRLLIYMFAVPAILIAAGFCFRKKTISWPPFVAVITLSVVLGLTGVEVYFLPEGRVGLSVVPILWGLPTRDAMKLMEQRKLFGGGCILPRCPPKTAIVITY